MEFMSAARCVPIRELSRSTSDVVAEVEREGRPVVISSRGRMVALLVPLPERLTIEFEEGIPAPTSTESGPVIDELELSELATQFLIDASSTPTGYWSPPDSAHSALKGAVFRALDELVQRKLALWESGTKIKVMRQGARLAQALRDQGRLGYAEYHLGAHGQSAHLHASG